MLLNLRICITGFILILSLLSAQFSVSCDIASRYVWRGTDFGNSASIQPSISYTSGQLTVGAWSAWQHSGVGNENDIYASYAMGDFSLTVTDYYFPLPILLTQTLIRVHTILKSQSVAPSVELVSHLACL